MEKTIAIKTVGKRTLNGTAWPVEHQVVRVAQSGRRPYWLLTLGLCNGTARGSVRYATKAGALAALAAASFGSDEVAS